MQPSNPMMELIDTQCQLFMQYNFEKDTNFMTGIRILQNGRTFTNQGNGSECQASLSPNTKFNDISELLKAKVYYFNKK